MVHERSLPGSRKNNISSPVRVFISRRWLLFEGTFTSQLERIIAPCADVRARVGMNEYEISHARLMGAVKIWLITGCRLTRNFHPNHGHQNCQASSMPFLIYVQRMLNDRKWGRGWEQRECYSRFWDFTRRKFRNHNRKNNNKRYLENYEYGSYFKMFTKLMWNNQFFFFRINVFCSIMINSVWSCLIKIVDIIYDNHH